MSKLITIKLTREEYAKFLTLQEPHHLMYHGFHAYYFTRELEKMLGIKIQLWQRILKRIIMIGFLSPSGLKYPLEGEFMRIQIKSPFFSPISSTMYVLVEE